MYVMICCLQNILDKFNPESKRMLTTAKAYLKALHNSSQASKTFNDSLAKLAQNANESNNLHGSTSDIGKLTITTREKTCFDNVNYTCYGGKKFVINGFSLELKITYIQINISYIINYYLDCRKCTDRDCRNF
jgi:IRSp53/MIM homology domain